MSNRKKVGEKVLCLDIACHTPRHVVSPHCTLERLTNSSLLVGRNVNELVSLRAWHSYTTERKKYRKRKLVERISEEKIKCGKNVSDGK